MVQAAAAQTQGLMGHSPSLSLPSSRELALFCRPWLTSVPVHGGKALLICQRCWRHRWGSSRTAGLLPRQAVATALTPGRKGKIPGDVTIDTRPALIGRGLAPDRLKLGAATEQFAATVRVRGSPVSLTWRIRFQFAPKDSSGTPYTVMDVSVQAYKLQPPKGQIWRLRQA